MTMPTTPPQWRRSSACTAGNCIEVASVADRILIRDSKHPDAPVLAFTKEEWNAFADAVKRDEFRFE
jgi:hypothetical protein